MKQAEIKLSATQIQQMQHCRKKGYFSTPKDKDWDELVEAGLATMGKDPFCSSCVVYRLTDEGKMFLSKIAAQ